MEEQEKKVQEEIDEIVKMQTGRANKVWEIRKKVVGGEKKQR